MNGISSTAQLSRIWFDEFAPMSASDRAAQFSPFAALVGYDDAVGETARLVESRIELTEDEVNALNDKLGRVLDLLRSELAEVTVTYFVPDARKHGGMYVSKTGLVRIYDGESNALVFTDGTKIAVADMYSISLQ